MTMTSDQQVLDLRGLAGTRETLVYHDGGQFPVLAALPDGSIVGVLRGGAGHVGLAGRIEIVRSRDGGRSWTPSEIIADSERDDRNPALGVSQRGTLVLAYHRQGSYDTDGTYAPELFGARGERPIEVLITRSHDGGLTWERPYPLGLPTLETGSPFGKIVSLPDGTLLMALYGAADPDLFAARAEELALSDAVPAPRALCSYLLRSHDDGLTWGEPVILGASYNETGILALPNGDVVAVLRGDVPNDSLAVIRSTDGGFSWTGPVQLTGTRQHPADLVALSDGSILLAYGNRNPPYRVEGRISRDGGQTWLPTLLTFSGHLYGYNVTEPRPTDLGYPSSVVLPGGQGVTLYYYTPSLRQSGADRLKLSSSFYSANDYRTIAVTWREEELLAALSRHG
jgi:hypothetical protein